MDNDYDQRGDGKALHRRFLNSTKDVSTVLKLVERGLGDITKDTLTAYKVQVCTAEALNNIVQHSGLQPGSRHIFLGLYPQRESIRVEIRDSGKPYNPPQKDIQKSVDENGRGWMILPQWTDRICYQRHGRINRLALIFKL